MDFVEKFDVENIDYYLYVLLETEKFDGLLVLDIFLYQKLHHTVYA